MKIKQFIVFGGLTVLMVACTKNDAAYNSAPEYSGSIKVDIKNVVGTDSLIFNTQNYVNANSDTFKINTFKYYVSNIALIKTNNAVVTIPESYFLVDAADISTTFFSLAHVPVAEYKAITLTIGVDSTHNVSGAQTGPLDPVHNMFWSWSTGYIFAKFEGTSPQSPGGNLSFHISGFSGSTNALKTVTLNFSDTLTTTFNNLSKIHLKADVLEWFMNPNTTKFSITNNITTTSAAAKAMADNYADMFTVTMVEN